MRFVENLSNAAFSLVAGNPMLEAAVGFFFNRFEAAQPSSPEHSYLPGFNREARYDANSYTRWEICRKMRYLEKNLWFAKANGDEHKKWTVGPNGLQIIPATSDKAFNQGVTESYGEWCQRPMVDSMQPMAHVHGLISNRSHFEGETFILKTFIKESGKKAVPAVQLIESHRCSSPGQDWGIMDQQKNLVDGVQIIQDLNGRLTRPQGYWFIDNNEGNQWIFRDASSIFHVMNPARPGMYRDISPYHPVIPVMNDFYDLEKMAMQKHKNNARFANIIKTASGEFSKDRMRQKRLLGTSTSQVQNDKKQDDLDRRVAAYRQILGAATFALKIGEDLEMVAANSPSDQEQWYWFYKIASVCKTVGMPFILLLPELQEGMQGTVVRAILDNAHETFRGYFYIYARAAIDMYLYFLEWAIRNDPRCFNAPQDWKRCHICPPRAVNVDVGYTADAMLAELGAGVTSWDDFGSRVGMTGEQLLRRKGEGVLLIKKIAKELSQNGDGIEVKPEEISSVIAEAYQMVAKGEPDDDEPPQKKKKKVKNEA